MPRPLNKIKAQPAVLSRDKAWFLGHLAGDGGFVSGTRRNEVTIFAGLDREIAVLCQKLFRTLYGANSRIYSRHAGRGKRKNTSWETTCSWKNVCADLLSYAPFGISRWRVPEAVWNGSDEIVGAWISGFADAEGSVSFKPEVSRRNVRVSSTNEQGLRAVSALLDRLGIRHSWIPARKRTPSAWRESFALSVTFHEDLRLFAERVGFRSSKKRRLLSLALASYSRLPRRTEEVAKHEEEITSRRRAGETHRAIADSLGLVREVVAGVCYRLGVEPAAYANNSAGGRRSTPPGIEEAKLGAVLELKAQGVPLRQIGIQLGFRDSVQGVQSLLQRAKRKGLIPWARKNKTPLPSPLPPPLQSPPAGGHQAPAPQEQEKE